MPVRQIVDACVRDRSNRRRLLDAREFMFVLPSFAAWWEWTHSAVNERVADEVPR